MKRYIFTALIVLALGTGVVLAQDHHKKAESGKTQKAKVEFTETIKLKDVMLRGEYLFVHDDERMARGEACMHVYNYANGKPGELVIAFHCKPVERPKAKQLIVNVAMTNTPDLFQLTEIQFAGTVKGHLVPGA